MLEVVTNKIPRVQFLPVKPKGHLSFGLRFKMSFDCLT